MAEQVIVIGGGLSGLSAAHTVIELGGRVTLIERNPFCGGNSTKATSGINGTPTSTQKAKNIPDTVEQFLKDTAKSAALGDDKAPPSELAKVMVYESGPAVEWL
jgi:succinate dehydrogenase/fumarate reductase flavoprotein subunit